MKVAFRHRPRKMRRRVDADRAVDAQNAPTAPWKTAQSAVSHSDHTHHLLDEGRSETIPLTRLTHEIPDTTYSTVLRKNCKTSWQLWLKILGDRRSAVRKFTDRIQPSAWLLRLSAPFGPDL